MVDKKQENSLAGLVRSMFSGRSTISSQSFAPSAPSPKSPAPRLGLSILSSPTIDLPGLPSHEPPPSSHMSALPCAANGARSSDCGFLTDQPPAAPVQPAASVQLPSPALQRAGQSSPRSNLERGYVRGGSGNTRKRRRRAKNARPRAAAKSIFRAKAGRMKLMRCLALGLVLVTGLAVYLALSLSNVIEGLQVHIFMIVIGILLVMAFAYATVRLCMYILQPPQYPISRTTSNATIAPQEPIPIILQRDEEDISEDEDEVDCSPKHTNLPPPPPAYGLWRGSTRMDPNLVHWRRVGELQREAGPPQRNSQSSEQPSSPYRPPSYATDDGVRYVLDAQPRATMQDSDSDTLPIHPSERGRIASGPS